jgi:hypothetical protein
MYLDTKIYLDTSILANNIMGRREYKLYTKLQLALIFDRREYVTVRACPTAFPKDGGRHTVCYLAVSLNRASKVFFISENNNLDHDLHINTSKIMVI